MKAKPYTMLLMMLAGWINRQQQDAINYLMEESKILKLGGIKMSAQTSFFDALRRPSYGGTPGHEPRSTLNET